MRHLHQVFQPRLVLGTMQPTDLKCEPDMLPIKSVLKCLRESVQQAFWVLPFNRAIRIENKQEFDLFSLKRLPPAALICRKFVEIEDIWDNSYPTRKHLLKWYRSKLGNNPH